MQGSGRTYGVGASFGAALFSRAIGDEDSVHIFEPLTAGDCERLAAVLFGRQCWVRIAPKAPCFHSLKWLANLHGCANVCLDLTTECALEPADIENLSVDVRHLILPACKDALHARIRFERLPQLESLTLSGRLDDLACLAPLQALRKLTLFRATLKSLEQIRTMPRLRDVAFQHARIDSLEGIECAPLERIQVFASRITNPEALMSCKYLERLELVASRVPGLRAPASDCLRFLRLSSLQPPMTLQSAWAISTLEYLYHDEGLREIESGFRPLPHPSLKQVFLGRVERIRARDLSRQLGVAVSATGEDLPFC